MKTLEITNWQRGLVVFDLFMFLWWVNVIFQFGNLILSYSVSTWFFTKRKETVMVIEHLQARFVSNKVILDSDLEIHKIHTKIPHGYSRSRLAYHNDTNTTQTDAGRT